MKVRVNDLARELGAEGTAANGSIPKKQSSICPICALKVGSAELSRHIIRKHSRHSLRSIYGPKTSSEKRLVPCPICKRDIKKPRLPTHLKKHSLKTPANAARPEKSKRAQTDSAYKVPVTTPQLETQITTSQLVPQTKVLLSCTKCGAKVLPDYLERHNENFHSGKQTLQLPISSVRRFPFVVFPPGTWDFRQVLDHYRKQLSPHRLGRDFDWERIEQIKRLRPRLQAFGLKAWSGYAVYEFSYSRQVVLECPIKGNATYILSGDWMKMIRLSKAEIRDEYASQSKRIVHKGDWLDRVRDAL